MNGKKTSREGGHAPVTKATPGVDLTEGVVGHGSWSLNLTQFGRHSLREKSKITNKTRHRAWKKLTQGRGLNLTFHELHKEFTPGTT